MISRCFTCIFLAIVLAIFLAIWNSRFGYDRLYLASLEAIRQFSEWKHWVKLYIPGIPCYFYAIGYFLFILSFYFFSYNFLYKKTLRPQHFELKDKKTYFPKFIEKGLRFSIRASFFHVTNPLTKHALFFTMGLLQ